MNKKVQILMGVLLVVAGFLGGSVLATKDLPFLSQKKTTEVTPSPNPVTPTAIPFNPPKSEKPEIKFFVMSFCPYGNQAEGGLAPVYELLGDLVDWQPRYILSDKKTSCEQNCPYQVYDEAQCQQLVDSQRVPDMATCKTYFPFTSADECLQKQCASLKTGEYDSLHGVNELNQNIREIVAFNQAALSKWWDFISLVNKNCTVENVETCWKTQATSAGLNSTTIASQASSQFKTLADKEIAETEKYQVSGSPTVFINDTLYNGGRSPEDYKKALCQAFQTPPEQCNSVLGEISANANGECN